MRINGAIAKGLLRLSNTCYKEGVKAALRVGSDATLQEFCIGKRRPDVFGVLGGPDMTWQEWRLKLLSWNTTALTTGTATFVLSITKPDSVKGCFLYLAQEAYIRGIRDYLARPHKVTDAGIATAPNMALLKERGLKAASFKELLVLANECIYNQSKIHSEASGVARFKPIGPTMWQKFSNQLWLAVITPTAWFDRDE